MNNYFNEITDFWKNISIKSRIELWFFSTILILLIYYIFNLGWIKGIISNTIIHIYIFI